MNDDNAALAGLVFCKATINAVGFVVRRTHMPAEICAVHLNLAGNGRAVCF
jgi:hypothetical protein